VLSVLEVTSSALREVAYSRMTKLFSVGEANALLPQLRILFTRVQAEKERMMAMQPDLVGAEKGHVYDWGTPRGPEYIGILESFHQALKDIEDLGVLIKDFDQGLCDFPHQREGRLVYLCWKLDEEEVTWWHDIDAGFAGRQPL
jgi:hypothetical protein